MNSNRWQIQIPPYLTNIPSQRYSGPRPRKRKEDGYLVQPCTQFSRYDNEHHVKNLSKSSMISEASIKMEQGVQDNHYSMPSSQFTDIVKKERTSSEGEIQQSPECSNNQVSRPDQQVVEKFVPKLEPSLHGTSPPDMFTEATIKKERESPEPEFQPYISANFGNENQNCPFESSQHQEFREFRHRFLLTQESNVNGNSDLPLMFSESTIKRQIENPRSQMQPLAQAFRSDLDQCLKTEYAPESSYVGRHSEPGYDIICYKCDFCSFTHRYPHEMYNHLKEYNHFSGSKYRGVKNNDQIIAKNLLQSMVIIFREAKFGDIVPMCPTCFQPFASIHTCMDHCMQVHQTKAVYSLGQKSRTWEGEISTKLLTAHIENQVHEMYDKPSKNEIALMVCTYCVTCHGRCFNKSIFTNFHVYQIHLREKHGYKRSSLKIQILYFMKSYVVFEMPPKANRHHMLLMENMKVKKSVLQ